MKLPKILNYFFLIILIIIIFISFFLWRGICSPKYPSAEDANFLIKKGESVEIIADNLQEEGIIKHKYFFILYILAQKKSADLIAGEYELSSSMSISEIAEKITSGDRIKKMITIIEGWTLKDIEEYLDMGEIDPNLEGYLFPDTYEIFPEDGLKDILEKMKENFEVKITEDLKEEIQFQGKTLEDIIIMASILEKEVQTLEDKKTVSGLLWKRINNNMALQVDAVSDTYKYKGLPPSPICNSGLNSILAAIYPMKTKYWFYLSSPDGETIFSTTFKEHQQAIGEHLK